MMPSTKNLTMKRFMAMFVGPNKSGKTRGYASFPGPFMVFNFDGPGRMHTIKADYPDLDIEYENVGPREVIDSDPDNCVIDFTEFCKRFNGLLTHCPYGTVVIDSFTSLSNTAVTFQMMARLGLHFNLNNIKKTKGGLPTAGFDEFNGETTTISMILDVAKVIPCNVILTAHPIPKQETNKEGEVIRKYTTIAAYGHKVDKIVPGYFTEIWNFRYEEDITPGARPKYFIGTVPTSLQVGSTALGLPPQIEWTNKNLWEVINEELKKVENQKQIMQYVNRTQTK